VPVFAEPRLSLTDGIVEKLIQHIADERLQPGDWLPSESRLTGILGGSRLALREALSRLKALGVIGTRQGKGAFIRQVNAANLFRQLAPLLRTREQLTLRHMAEVRQALEPAVAGLAAGRCSPAELRHLEDCLAEMTAQLKDKARFIQADIEFHLALARATGNPALEILVTTIREVMAATQWGYQDDLAARRRSLLFHRKIQQAVHAGNAAVARKTMAAHLLNVAANLEEKTA